jgi:hypothetical protein
MGRIKAAYSASASIGSPARTGTAGPVAGREPSTAARAPAAFGAATNGEAAAETVLDG